jgi:hypothetical protein
MFFPKILIRPYEGELLEDPLKKKKGKILHHILSKIKCIEDFENVEIYTSAAFAYFGERISKWNVEEEFIMPIKKIILNPKAKEIFPYREQIVSLWINQVNFSPYKREVAKKGCVNIFIERDILIPENGSFKIIRPDRILEKNTEVVVVDFKSEFLKKTHKVNLRQIKEYMVWIEKILKKQCYGFLIYVLSNKIITIN